MAPDRRSSSIEVASTIVWSRNIAASAVIHVRDSLPNWNTASAKSTAFKLPGKSITPVEIGDDRTLQGELPINSRVGFLFNHDQVHQVAHSAPIAFELSRSFPDLSVTLIACSAEETAMLQQIAERFPGHRCEMKAIRPSGALGWLSSVFDGLAPMRKVSLLRDNVEFFRQFDALVVPEKTSLLLRTQFGIVNQKMIHTRHGAGDRAVGFDQNSGRFDFVLLAGEKIRRRLSAAGQLQEGRYAVVGYPKFDAVGAFSPVRKRLFDNDRPTVLYNPHCSPHLSSWYGMGFEIMEQFYNSDRYNLIVAPHVMLYRRRLQVSIDRFSFAWAARIPKKYRNASHMIIDTGSTACSDMTYTMAADVYLGDVSSQVCEFLVQPRPCVFANAHDSNWQTDPSYSAWHLGPVVDRVENLFPALQRAIASHADYRPAQERYFDETFDLSNESPSMRAASAVAEFLRVGTVKSAPREYRDLVGAKLADAIQA